MRWAVFGLVLLAIVATLIVGTDAGAGVVRRGIFYQPPPSRTLEPGETFRLTPPATPRR